MIAAWMAYGLLVSGLVALAAWAIARLLGRRGLAVRPAWAAGLAVGALLPAAAALTEPLRRVVGELLGRLLPVGSAPSGAPGAVPALEPLTVPVNPSSFLAELDGLLLALWLAASSILLIRWIRARRRLDETARSGSSDMVGSVRVIITRDTGPAVVGVLRGRILLPGWLAEGEPRILEMVLLHEREHVEARDTTLLLLAFLAVAAVPWNPILWWMRHRLREAVEMDCDARVLRRRPGILRDYALALVDVGARTRGLAAPAAALTEPSSLLERRIRTMTDASPRRSLPRIALLVATATLALAFACSAPPPGEDPVGVETSTPSEQGTTPATPSEQGTTPSEQETAASEQESDPDSSEREARSRETPADTLEPSFTPYTRAPDLVNSNEVVTTLRRAYPPLLKDANIGGTILVWFYIDRTGDVLETRIRESSGQEELDEAALRVARTMEFTAAMNGDEAVRVWISLPITFTTS